MSVSYGFLRYVIFFFFQLKNTVVERMLKNVKIISYFWDNKLVKWPLLRLNYTIEEAHLHINAHFFTGVLVFM